MPTNLSRTPRYCRQRHKGRPDRAYVQIGERRVWLGTYGSLESHRRYAEAVSSEATSGEPPSHPAPQEPTLAELMAKYLNYANARYGQKSGEVVDFKGVFKILRREHSGLPAKLFGPKAFQQSRKAMIDKGWSRRYINEQCQRVKRFISWGVAEELLPRDARFCLDAVPGLTMGEFGVRDSDPVEPVSDEAVAATLPHLSETVGDMVKLMRLTGMRPGELVQLGTDHIDREREIWVFRPPQHKTRKRGKHRSIALGPKSQVILSKYMRLDRCFSYSTASFRRAIQRGCDRASIERWSPNQLRHTAATAIRQQFGLDHAQVVLGHSHADVTQIYAEANQQKAIEVAKHAG